MMCGRKPSHLFSFLCSEQCGDHLLFSWKKKLPILCDDSGQGQDRTCLDPSHTSHHSKLKCLISVVTDVCVLAGEWAACGSDNVWLGGGSSG